jgi:hypothetical protein
MKLIKDDPFSGKEIFKFSGKFKLAAAIVKDIN